MDSQQQMEFKLPENKRGLQVVVRVRFGNPKYGDCRNFGICKMELVDDLRVLFEKRDGYACGVIVKVVEGYEILFVKKTMTERTVERNFELGAFRVDGRKRFGREVEEMLGEREVLLLPGRYRVFETKNYFKIKIAI